MSMQVPWVRDVVDDWLVGKTFKAMLLGAAANAQVGNVSEVTEIVGTGYTAGGLAVTVATAVVGQGVVVEMAPTELAWPDLVANQVWAVAIYEPSTGAIVGIDAFGPIDIATGQGLTYTMSPTGFGVFQVA